VRTSLGIRDSEIETPRLPESLARLLLRTEEYEEGHRDQWNCWEHSFSENFRRGTLWVPEVDEWTAARRAELASRTALEPLWPENRQFVVCLTHDVDMISRQTSPAQLLRSLRIGLSSLPTGRNAIQHRALRAAQALARAAYFGIASVPSAFDTLERSIEVEREYDVRSSYFFTVYPSLPTPYDCAYRPNDSCLFRDAPTTVSDLMRWLVREGWDVGLHGSYLSAVERDLLEEEKGILEEALGERVKTVRQHYLHFDVRKTPRLQGEAGFSADSTLGFNRNVGFRAGTSLPFRLFDFSANAPVLVLEVPLIIQEAPLLSANALELDPDLAEKTIVQLFDAIARVGGVATLLFHPHSLRQPAFMRLYRFSIERALEQGAWIASLASVAEWWQAREERLLASEQQVQLRP
jgi:peptidoglycan/xylan/chitin deacetylase (PgdA/CDA1 family)